MKHLLEEEGRRALAGALGAHPLLAFDFDGTLAPLVSHPGEAAVPAPLAARLDRLSCLRPLAIVTGRSVDDVSGRLGFTAAFIVGNHGAEDPAVAIAIDSTPLEELRTRIAAGAAALQGAGIAVEDKRLSLALHYRQAPDQARALQLIEHLLGELPPTLRKFPGKCVVNLVLAAAPDKFDAVAALVQRAGCDAAIFVGDDVNDETVFSQAPAHWLTVRVGRENSGSRATYFLAGYEEVAVLLAMMLDTLEAQA
jgi:trehalose 6-phosphate phosphatase